MEQEIVHNNEITPTEGNGFSSTHQTILTGKALEERHEEAVKFGGILSAPADFLEQKKSNFLPSECHVRVDYHSMQIVFHMDERKFNGNEVHGKLSESKVLTRFGINTGKEYSNFELAQLFRLNKYWFASAEDQVRIISELQKFQANVSTKIKAHADNSGASLQHLEREVNGIQWNRTFRLNIPLFEGYERVAVPVEIGVTPTASAVRFFLESPEIYELIEEQKGGLIQAQIERFKDWGCSIVRIS